MTLVVAGYSTASVVGFFSQQSGKASQVEVTTTSVLSYCVVI